MTLYENENTLHRFITSKGEKAFHDRYEEAIENIKSEFGRRYTMIIGGKNVTASESFVHTSPIDTRIVLAYFPSGTAKHVQQAIKAGKKAFESWGKTDYKERVEFCRMAIDIMNRRKFELAAWLSYGNGKNRYEAICDVDEAVDFIKVKLRHVIAEMGGKNPAIVTENADINKAVEGIFKAAFGYSGQKCSACSRVYIQKSIKNKFVERLVERTKNLSVGNPLESNTFIGPLINSKAYKNYQKYAKLAYKDGNV